MRISNEKWALHIAMHNRLMACVATVFFHQAVEEKTFLNVLLSFQHACNVIFVIKLEKEKVPHAELDALQWGKFADSVTTVDYHEDLYN